MKVTHLVGEVTFHNHRYMCISVCSERKDEGFSSVCSVDCTLATVACMTERRCRINILDALNEGCAHSHCSERCARILAQLYRKSPTHYQRIFTCYFAQLEYSIYPCGDPYAARPHLRYDEKAMGYLYQALALTGRSNKV